MTTRIKHLYIHVPFCKTICYYCDFCHRIYDSKIVDKWLNRLQKEVKESCFEQYETIYIGGGTPTSLNSDELRRLLELIKPFSKSVIEYTIEVNPESLDLDKILLFKEYGINRISMGVQSSDDKILKSLNRNHSFGLVKQKIQLLKDNGLDNISVDLMYSLPNQTIAILDKAIKDILELDVPHISLYSLTIEDNTVFKAKGYEPLDIDTEADMYELIDKTLKENGYVHYEVSNFCKPGYQSKHNLAYWNYDNYLGLSLAGSSKVENRRWTNTRSFEKYFNDENIKDEDLLLDINDLKFENIMMSLRTIYGLNIEEFNKKYDCDLLSDYRKGISNPNVYIEDGYLKVKNLEILNNTLLDFMK